ncbi:hypothetical protein AHAS_Ahas11G0128000 [Arachis hypogaea]
MMNYVVSFEKFQKFSKCKTAKEIWDKLQVTHESTQHVKEIRIDMPRKEYEMFTMKEGETIDELFERFSIITNSLNAMRMTDERILLDGLDFLLIERITSL